MISQIEESYDFLKMTSDLRDEMMSWLSDSDLEFTIAGNVSLGALCRRVGEVQQMYIDGFKTFTMDWDYEVSNAVALEASVDMLIEWYNELDEELRSVLDAFSEVDLERLIDRQAFKATVEEQLRNYGEALLIFYGKATIYLNALDKRLTDRWHGWIGNP